jgi:hypothetical protein
MLWETINTLQMVVIVTLFNLSFPDNAMFLFKLIAEISKFNVIPTDDIVNALFAFSEEDDGRIIVNLNFDEMGYDSSNIL